jgi:hypothetical protein
MNDIEKVVDQELKGLIGRAHDLGLEILDFAIVVLFTNDSMEKLEKAKDPTISELGVICRGIAKWQEITGKDFEYMLRTAEILDEVLECISDGGSEDEKHISDKVVELQEIYRIQMLQNNS